MIVRPAREADLDAWAEMRAALWPELGLDDHRAEAAEALGADGVAVFVAEGADRSLIGFAEAALRHDYVNGCETSPVAFVEGVYVRPEHRRAEAGRALCAAIADWGKAQGCFELASDALLDNAESHAFHAAIGFEETERVVYFRRAL